MKNYLSMAGGVLTAVSMFLAFVGGLSLSGMDYFKMGDRAWVGYMWIVCGVIMIACGYVGKKGTNILGILVGLLVLGISIKYKMDIGKAGLDTGIGLWLMMAGGALGVIGFAMAFRNKTA